MNKDLFEADVEKRTRKRNLTGSFCRLIWNDIIGGSATRTAHKQGSHFPDRQNFRSPSPPPFSVVLSFFQGCPITSRNLYYRQAGRQVVGQVEKVGIFIKK